MAVSSAIFSSMVDPVDLSKNSKYKKKLKLNYKIKNTKLYFVFVSGSLPLLLLQLKKK